MADISADLATFAAQLTFDSLPGEVVSTTKHIVLDTLGTTLAANTLGVGCPELVEVVRSAAGTPESTILGFGDRVPALSAALANGAMAHALNYDDSRQGHLGPTSLPAALAAAERRGGISGRELITALAAGNEVMARLCLAVRKGEANRPEGKPQPTQMPGYFNAAISAGRVFGLDASGIHSAMGVALMQAAGDRQPVLESTSAKALYTGFSGHGGMLGALLALQGLRAECDVFEGEAGLFNTFYLRTYEREPLEKDLGGTWRMLDVGFKPWPISANTHPFIEAALQLRAQHKLEPSQIQAIHIRGGAHIKPWVEPPELRRKPQTSLAAEDSVYFGVSKALANGSLTLADFSAAGLRQAESQRLADLISYSIDPELGSSGIVSITTREAQRFDCRVDHPLGSKLKPLTYTRLVEKFVDCAQHAARPISRKALDEAVEKVDRLEALADVSELATLLTGGDPLTRPS